MDGDTPSANGHVGRRRIGGARSSPPLWFGIPFVLGGLLAFGLGIVLLRDETRLADEGAEISAAITDRVFNPGTGDDADSYRITYEFVDPSTGVRHVGSSSVSRSSFDALASETFVLVTYLPSAPTTSRIGPAELQLFMPLLVMAFGILFAVAGSALLRISWRARQRARGGVVDALISTAAALVGPRSDGLSATELARVDRFTRSSTRVVGELLLAPLGGIAFLGLAVVLVNQIGTDPTFIVFAGLSGFFGVLLLSGIPTLLRRGVGRTLLEVGPDGIRHRDLGRLAWSEIREVRIEQAIGPGGSEATLATYHRLGIVPADASRTSSLPGGVTRGLVGAFIRFANDQARRRGARRVMTEPAELAPLGVYAYEIEQPIGELVASLRRFGPVVAAVQPSPASSVTERSFAPAAPDAPGTVPDIRALDAALAGPPADHQPALAVAGATAGSGSTMRLAALVEPAPFVASPATGSSTTVVAASIADTARVDVFNRRGFSPRDALSILLPGESTTLPPVAGVIGRAIFGAVFAVVPALILLSALEGAGRSGSLLDTLVPLAMLVVFVGVGVVMIRGTRGRWRLATGDATLLTVGPEGLVLRDRAMTWEQVRSVISRSGRLEISAVGGDVNEPIFLDFDMFEADDDQILDSIARYRVVDEA